MSYVCVKCSAGYDQYVPWCISCMTERTVVLRPRRPPSMIRSEMQTASARDLIKREWSQVESAAYPELRFGRGALVAVYGPPGSGKSTWVTRYANGLDGAVVYFAAEEGLSPTTAERLVRCGVKRSDFVLVGQGAIDDVVALCRKRKATALVIDSIAATTVQPSDLRRLLESTGVAILLIVLQTVKDGRHAGSQAFLHEADVVVHVLSLNWNLTKSRYQALCSGDV